MTDHADPDEAGGAEPADLGTPVEQLRDLSLDVGGEFAPRVRRSIERRHAIPLKEPVRRRPLRPRPREEEPVEEEEEEGP